MADLKVIRQATVADTKLTYSFDVRGFRFLVKNFTSGNVYVSLDPDEADINKMILIPKKVAQLVLVSEIPNYENGAQEIYVTPATSHPDGVEIQCVLW